MATKESILNSEMELKASSMSTFEETKELLNDSSLFYIVCIDMDENFSYVNNRYQKQFEHVDPELKGKSYKISMHEDDSKICAEVSLKCFENPEKTFPATIRKHDGYDGYVCTQWEYKALFNEKGEPAGMFCLGYDITSFVVEKSEHENSKTIIQKKETIITEIAFSESHLIRRPLANILGLSLLLESMEMDANLRNVCNMIIESSKQLDEVIKENMRKIY